MNLRNWRNKMAHDKKLRLIIFISVAVSFAYPIIIAGADVNVNIQLTGIGIINSLLSGGENTNMTRTTDSEWAWDEIVVETKEDANSVLDQLVFQGDLGTHISRNALYIGEGSINTTSQYKGSHGGGEDSLSGTSVEGENYGVLIQHGSLEFNEDFGGADETVLAAGGNYTIGQWGGFGNIDSGGNVIRGEDDPWISLTLRGDQSGSIQSSVFGSETEPNTYYANSTASAIGLGDYSFKGYSVDMDALLYLQFTQARVYIVADFERLKAEALLMANIYE